MADFLTKNKGKEQPRPESSFLRNQDGDIPVGRKLNLPADESATTSGFVGTEPQPSPETVNYGQGRVMDADQPQTPTFSSEPSPVDQVGKLISTGALATSPYYQQILAKRAELTALEMQPTYTKMKGGKPVLGADGQPVQLQGMQDKDGRIQSGLKGLIAGLAENFSGRPVRDMGDFYGRLTGSIVRGAGGAIVPEWNEIADRQEQIQRKKQEVDDLTKQAEFDSKLQTQEVTRQNTVTDNNRQAEDLKRKKGADWHRQNPSFDPTNATPAQVKQLAEIGETPFSMGHYDRTKPNVKVINGVSFLWNAASRSFEPSNLPKKDAESIVEYSVKDPDTDVVSTYAVAQKDAARMKTDLLRAGLQINAANERQASQQKFTLKQMEIRSQMEKEAADYKAAIDEKKMDKAAEIRERLIKLQEDYKNN